MITINQWQFILILILALVGAFSNGYLWGMKRLTLKDVWKWLRK
jgi:hypothetical protein